MCNDSDFSWPVYLKKKSTIYKTIALDSNSVLFLKHK